MSYKTDIEDLIGSVNDDNLITNSIQEVGAEIVNVLPINKLRDVSATASITSSGLSVADKRVIGVDKGDLVAREILSTNKAKYKDANSIYASSDEDPVFYIEGEKVYVIGDASLNETSGTLHYVPKIPTTDGSAEITAAGDTVVNFPKEAKGLITLGGAVRCLQRLMSDITDNLPADLSYPVIPSSPTTPSAPSFTYTDASVGDLVQPLVAISDMAALTASAPSYSPPVVSPSFSTVDTFISTDEDVELASVKIQEINSQISQYQSDMQNALNTFNEDNVAYQEDIQRKGQNFQKDIQVAIQNMQQEFNSRKANLDKEVQLNLQNAINNYQKEVQEYGSTLNKYSADIQEYQAEVGSVIQKFSSDVQNYNAQIQKQNTDYQWKQGQYRQLKAEYNQGLQLIINGNMPQQQGG